MSKPAIEIPRYFNHAGDAFRFVAEFTGAKYREDANAYMEAHPDVSLLHADDEKQIAQLAYTADLGRAIRVDSNGGVRNLSCACCGAPTRGRQWHNRDTGYGLCSNCVDYCARGETAESFERCYGLRGIHFDLKE